MVSSRPAGGATPAVSAEGSPPSTRRRLQRHLSCWRCLWTPSSVPTSLTSSPSWRPWMRASALRKPLTTDVAQGEQIAAKVAETGDLRQPQQPLDRALCPGQGSHRQRQIGECSGPMPARTTPSTSPPACSPGPPPAADLVPPTALTTCAGAWGVGGRGVRYGPAEGAHLWA